MFVFTLVATAVLLVPQTPEAQQDTTAPAVADTTAPAAVDSTAHAAFASDSLNGVANEKIASGDFRSAADLFQQLVASYPASPFVADALYWRAFALYRLGADDELRQSLQTLTTMQEQYPSAFLNGDAAALRLRVLGELARRGDAEAAQQIAQQTDQPVAADSQAAAGSQAASGAGGTGCDMSNANGSGADVKIAALNALVQMNPDRAAERLSEILKRQDEPTTCLRRAAVLLLAQHAAPGVEASLLGAARSDPDLEVRKQAVLALSQFNTAEAFGALDSIVRTGNDPELVERAVMALSQSDNPSAQQAVRAYAERNDTPPATRRTAILWLVGRPSPENVAFLRDLYGKTEAQDTSLRQSIIQAVAQQNDSATAHWLLTIAGSGDDPLPVRLQALALAKPSASLSDLTALYAPELDASLREPLVDMYGERLTEPAALDALGEVAKRDGDTALRRKAIGYLSQSSNPHAVDVLQGVVQGP